MGKHSAGPWEAPHFARDDVSCNCTSVVCEGYPGAIATIGIDNGKPIGDGGNGCPPLEEAKANARLIAAAPCMKEALEVARAQLVTLGGEHSKSNPDHDQIQAAVLAKIEAGLSRATKGGEDL